MILRRVLLAAALCAAQPALPAAGLLDEARTAVKSERLDQAEQLLRQQLLRQQHDDEARFLLARVLAWQGKRGEAHIEYDALLKAHPQNADYLLGKAQTLVWDGQPAQALPLLQHARRVAPRYEDVWRLQIAALIAVGDEYRLRQARTIQAMAAERFPKSDWRVAGANPAAPAPPPASPPALLAIAPSMPPVATPAEPPPVVAQNSATASTSPNNTPPGNAASPIVTPASPGASGDAALSRRTELELGLTSEGLTNGYAGWRSIYLEGLHRFGERKAVYGTLRETERFGLHDSEAQGGFYYPLGDTWTSLVEASVSPTYNVLPKFSLFGQLQKTLDYGWGLHAGIRHSEYPTLNTNIGVFTAERYWSNFRGAYSLYLGRPAGGSTAPSHVLALDYYYGERNFIGIAVNDGREVAGLGPLGVITSDVRGVVLRGRHWLTPDWAVSFEALHQEQGSLYIRHGARIGLRRAF